MRLYSQNIDSLDTRMPTLTTAIPLNTEGPWPTTVQLHGGLEKMVCATCNDLEPFNPSLFDGPEPPLCRVCTEQDLVRTNSGKRSRGIGRLRPRIDASKALRTSLSPYSSPLSCLFTSHPLMPLDYASL